MVVVNLVGNYSCYHSSRKLNHTNLLEVCDSFETVDSFGRESRESVTTYNM